MSKVTFTMSTSVDGFIRAANPTPDEPLGQGGECLHEWAFGDEGREFLAKLSANLGAVVTGRKTYEDSLRGWGANGPTGKARLPVFVVTHKAPATSLENGVYRFVTSGVAEAVRQAKEAAGGKDISIMGGPSVGNQALREGLVDEIFFTVTPFLFGGGTRFFEQLAKRVQLDKLSVVDQKAATHIRYRVIK